MPRPSAPPSTRCSSDIRASCSSRSQPVRAAGSSSSIGAANIPEAMARAAQQTAVDSHIALGCEGYSRTDIMAADDGPYFLELNTLPGLTTSSLVPQELRA